MSRSAMNSLAHCQLGDNVSSGALWMPMGNPAKAFRSDFPVQGRPHSIGVLIFYNIHTTHATGRPGIYTWASVRIGENAGAMNK